LFLKIKKNWRRPKRPSSRNGLRAAWPRTSRPVLLPLRSFCKRDPTLSSNRATLGATITQETNFTLWTPNFTVFAKGRSPAPLCMAVRLRPAPSGHTGHLGPTLTPAKRPTTTYDSNGDTGWQLETEMRTHVSCSSERWFTTVARPFWRTYALSDE
jgi:hypothetical protein